MEKKISNFTVDLAIGTYIKSFKCVNCNTVNHVTLINNKYLTKITDIYCKNCKTRKFFGDIYNFDTGNKLNKRIKTFNNHETLTKINWNEEYRNI